jgi:hypothetical protein
METIFNVVPDLMDWIPAQDLGRSTRVYLEWRRTLLQDRFARLQPA